MDPRYQIRDPSAIFSPALVFQRQVIEDNLERMLQIARRPDRLRPHAKTHKTREIIRLELAKGINKHKVATLAEAELVAEAGAPDVLLAYPMVGPNCDRFARLLKTYPATRFSVVADSGAGLEQLAAALRAGPDTEVLLDIDVGQHRTGVAPGPEALRLCEMVSRQAGMRPGGLHVYDGHNNQESFDERKQAVAQLLGPVRALIDDLHRKGLPVPRVVAGGTPTFGVWAAVDLPGLECSPGTCVLHDHGYGSKYPDLGMTAAALLLTRVVSKPGPNRLTFDLGTKAVASDPPAGRRCIILDLPDAKMVLHSEEHLVVETAAAGRFAIGQVACAVPTHICPTCALHKQALVVENGEVVDRWEIVGRDRMLIV